MTKKKFGSLLLVASLVTTLLFSACTTGGAGNAGGSVQMHAPQRDAVEEAVKST